MTVKDVQSMLGDRDPLPRFAGRSNELSELDGQLDNVLLGNTTGGIQLITGVPGAGKSHLARKFAECARARDNVQCEWVDVATVGRDVDLFLTIAEAFDKVEEARKVADLNAKFASFGINLGVFGGQATRDLPRHTSAFPRLLAALRTAVGKKRTWGETEALVLLIAELHTIRPQAMENLRYLHRGDHGCPIMVVGVGLHHTETVLARPEDGSPGISSMSPPMVLGVLPENEAQEAIRKNIAAIAGENLTDHCVAKLAVASHHFPQHIHAYVAGAVEVVREEGHRRDGALLKAALRRGDAKRSSYYLDRLVSMGMSDPVGAIGHLVVALRERGTDVMLADDAIAVFDGTKHDGEAVVEAAVAQGVLTQHRDGSVGFDIPAFRTFVLEKLRERKALVSVGKRVGRQRKPQVATGLRNPFRPGTAAMPPQFAGRHTLLRKVMALAEPLCLSARGNSAPTSDIILSGPQGIGKTVLLRTIESELEAKFQDEYAKILAEDKDRTILRSTFQSFRTRESAIKTICLVGRPWQSIVYAKGVSTEFGLPQTIHSALASRLEDGRPLSILIDDAHGIKPAIVEELLSAGQLLRSQGAPLLLVLAGTEGLVACINKVDRTLLKRSAFIPVGPLDDDSARQAVAEPLRDVGADPRELGILLGEAEGHPLHLQELGDLVIRQLNVRGTKTVTVSVSREVQQRFKSLKATRDTAIRTALDSDLSRRKSYKSGVKRLKSETKLLEARRDKLDAQKKRLEKRHGELDSEKKDIETQRVELELGRKRLDERDRELDLEKTRLEDRRGDFRADKKRLEGQRTEMDAEKERLADRHGELESEKRRLAGRDRELDMQKALLEDRREEFRADKKRLEDQWAEMDVEKRRLADRYADLDLERKGLEDRRTEMDLEKRHLEDERGKLDSERKHVEGRRGVVNSTEGRLEEQRAELAVERKRLEKRRAEMDAEKKHLENWRGDMDSETQRLDKRRKEVELESRKLADFYLQKKRQRPTRWRWLFGDDEPPA